MLCNPLSWWVFPIKFIVTQHELLREKFCNCMELRQTILLLDHEFRIILNEDMISEYMFPHHSVTTMFSFFQVKIFIRIVGGNKSLYGLQPVKSSINPQFGQSSTLDSLILDLLPPSSHKLCQARCEDDIDSSEPVTFILDETIKILRSSAGFKIPEVRTISACSMVICKKLFRLDYMLKCLNFRFVTLPSFVCVCLFFNGAS